MPLKDTANRESSRHSCQDLLAQDHVEEPSAAMHPVPASQMGRWPTVFMWRVCVSVRVFVCVCMCVPVCAHPSVLLSSCELRVFLGQLWSFLLSECVCCVSVVWFSWCNSSALPSCSRAICGFCGDDSSHSSLGDRCCLLLSYHPSWRFVSFINLSGSLHSRNCASLKFFEQSSLDMEHLSKLTVRPFLLHLDELGRNSCEHTRPLTNPPLGARGSHLTSPMVLERSECSLLDLGMWPSWENAHSSRIKPWV